MYGYFAFTCLQLSLKHSIFQSFLKHDDMLSHNDIIKTSNCTVFNLQIEEITLILKYG